ncbi:MAG: hypothetical protein VX619_12095 [bacterium]|nr:hypothetical protein [bacterium]
MPLILGVLAVFSILLLVLSRAGTQTYTQNALANYNLHARMHALAISEYVTTVLHARMSDPLRSRSTLWRFELIDALLKGQPEHTIDFMVDGINLEKDMRKLLIGEGLGDPTNPGGFQGGQRITDHADNKLKESDKFEILKAKVKFHHFKPIRFDTLNPSVYHDPTRYYHHPLMESSGIAPIGDLIGFYTIYVKIRFGFVEREIAITKDIKIINNEPIARNFALFAMGAPNAKYMQNDLNQGGKFTVLAQNKGRIRLQGPYIIDTEGYPDGLGGSRPVGLSYPEKRWDSSAFIPSPRGITTSGFLFKSSIKRPKKISGNGLSIGLGTTQGLGLVMSSDPGVKGQPEVQEYWAANTKVGQQKFSISGTAQNFNGWKGLMVQEGQADNAVIGIFNGDLGELEKSAQARVEGSLYGRFNQMHYSKRSVCMSLSTIISGFMGLKGMFGSEDDKTSSESQNLTSITSNEIADVALDLVQACWINYKVNKKGTVPYYYGLYSPYSSKVSKMEGFLNIMNETLEAYSTKGQSSDGGGFLSAASSALQQSSDRLAQAELSRNTVSGEIKPYDERWAPDLYGVLPSNFKKFGRTAARKYDSIKEHFRAHPGTAKRGELFLDGNIWVNELDLRNDIVYFGKGTLISAFTPGSVLFTATKQARIKNLRPADPQRDHLNLFYRNSNAPESAGGMLKLDGDFEGSLYSYQGVRPMGSDIRIKGNLIVEIFNKAQTSNGENLTVEYNPDYLEADKQAYNWFTISLSPKISGLTNNVKTNAVVNGAGEDGVKVILKTLGE